jgi:hypothetical protein
MGSSIILKNLALPMIHFNTSYSKYFWHLSTPQTSTAVSSPSGYTLITGISNQIAGDVNPHRSSAEKRVKCFTVN